VDQSAKRLQRIRIVTGERRLLEFVWPRDASAAAVCECLTKGTQVVSIDAGDFNWLSCFIHQLVPQLNDSYVSFD